VPGRLGSQQRPGRGELPAALPVSVRARRVSGWADATFVGPGQERNYPASACQVMNVARGNDDAEQLLEIGLFTDLLQQQGVHAALEYLNRRTPHRYTGLFRFDGELLRNEVLFDRNVLRTRQGSDVPLAETYCALVGRQEAPVIILDAPLDPQAQGIDTSVISYCGVLIRDAQGQAYGTLCHYDMQRCQERTTDLVLLEAAAQLFYRHLPAAPATAPVCN